MGGRQLTDSAPVGTLQLVCHHDLVVEVFGNAPLAPKRIVGADVGLPTLTYLLSCEEVIDKEVAENEMEDVATKGGERVETARGGGEVWAGAKAVRTTRTRVRHKHVDKLVVEVGTNMHGRPVFCMLPGCGRLW